MKKQQTTRWIEDTTIVVSRETRAALKIKAAIAGISIKQLLEDFAKKHE